MLSFPEILKPPVKRAISGITGKKILEKLVEFFSIIISIYLALTFEGWSEKKSDHKKMLYYYENLIVEIVKDTATLDSAIQNAVNHLESTRKHIKFLRNYSPAIKDSVMDLYTKMGYNLLFYSSQMLTYNSIVETGDIKHIEDLKVRNKLAELNEVYISLKIHEDMYLKYIEDDIMRSFMNNIDLLKMQISDADYFKSMFYRNLVAGFYVQNENRLAQYKSALQKAKETLALISEELESEK